MKGALRWLALAITIGLALKVAAVLMSRDAIVRHAPAAPASAVDWTRLTEAIRDLTAASAPPGDYDLAWLDQHVPGWYEVLSSPAFERWAAVTPACASFKDTNDARLLRRCVEAYRALQR